MPTAETFPYDAAEYLDQPQDICVFLEAVLEEEDTAYWPSALQIVVRDLLVRLMEAYRPAMIGERANEKVSHAI